MLTANIISITCLTIFVGIVLWARNNEKKSFNNGRCKTCGKRLIHVDTDSQGGRLYKCPDGMEHHSCWVSYNVDKDF